MTIELSKDAEKYLNEQAEELLLLLQPANLKKKQPDGKAQSSATHVFTETIAESEITDFRITGTVDHFGAEKSRYFQTQLGPIGLEGDSYTRFEGLINMFSSRAELRKLLTANFLKIILFEWFEKRHKGELTSSTNFVACLKERALAEIKTRKISIPISYMTIEKPFKIGNITFEYYTTDFFDQIEKHIRANVGNQTESLNEGIRAIRKRYQGVVFASISVHAETEKCIDIANQETENALMVLRFFSPTTFVPEIPSYFGMMGKVHIPSRYLFIFEDGLSMPTIKEEFAERRDPMCILREQDIQDFKNHGLGHASELITKENRTELEELLMTSLFLFTRGTVAKEFQDKLVFTLVSIETLLLQNQSEPIQRSVGLRLCFLAASKVNERKQVVDLVKEAYKERSKYLHHGHSKSDFELLQKLQHIVWTAFINVLSITDRYSTQNELLKFIEEKILS